MTPGFDRPRTWLVCNKYHRPLDWQEIEAHSDKEACEKAGILFEDCWVRLKGEPIIGTKMNNKEKLYPSRTRAIITIHPYRETGWRGWVVAIQDPKTNELIHRRFYYKTDATGLVKDIEGKTFSEIIGIYGWKYFEKVR